MKLSTKTISILAITSLGFVTDAFGQNLLLNNPNFSQTSGLYADNFGSNFGANPGWEWNYLNPGYSAISQVASFNNPGETPPNQPAGSNLVTLNNTAIQTAPADRPAVTAGSTYTLAALIGSAQGRSGQSGVLSIQWYDGGGTLLGSNDLPTGELPVRTLTDPISSFSFAATAPAGAATAAAAYSMSGDWQLITDFNLISGVGTPRWIGTASGNYFAGSNWRFGNIPNGIDAFADFSTPIAAGTRTVFADTTVTLGTLRFESPNTYQLVGTELVLSSTSTAAIDVVSGSPKINLPTTFATNTAITTAAGSTLLFSDPLTLAPGVTVTANGTGVVTLQSTISASAPATLKLNTGSVVNFDAGNNSPNLRLVIDPATVNLGSTQTLATVALELGGNTLKVGRTSSGSDLPAALNTPALVVTGGAGGDDTIDTTLAQNTVNVSGAVTLSPGATLVKAGPGSLAARRIDGAGRLVLSAGTVRLTTGNTASVVNQLSVQPAADLDLTNNALVVLAGDVTALRARVAAWVAGGKGISSSSDTAATTVAVFPNTDGAGGPYYSRYGTVTGLTGSSVILRFTYLGDTNLDGLLNGQDLAKVIEGFTTGRSGWEWGDVDYSGGPVTASDVTAVLALVNQNLPSLGFPLGGADRAGAVPEPAALGLFLPALATLARRRR